MSLSIPLGSWTPNRKEKQKKRSRAGKRDYQQCEMLLECIRASSSPAEPLLNSKQRIENTMKLSKASRFYKLNQIVLARILISFHWTVNCDIMSYQCLQNNLPPCMAFVLSCFLECEWNVLTTRNHFCNPSPFQRKPAKRMGKGVKKFWTLAHLLPLFFA